MFDEEEVPNPDLITDQLLYDIILMSLDAVSELSNEAASKPSSKSGPH